MEEIDEQQREFRGQATHVVTGGTLNFRHWSDLETFLMKAFDDYKEGTNGEPDDR